MTNEEQKLLARLEKAVVVYREQQKAIKSLQEENEKLKWKIESARKYCAEQERENKNAQLRAATALKTKLTTVCDVVYGLGYELAKCQKSDEPVSNNLVDAALCGMQTIIDKFWDLGIWNPSFPSEEKPEFVKEVSE